MAALFADPRIPDRRRSRPDATIPRRSFLVLLASGVSVGLIACAAPTPQPTAPPAQPTTAPAPAAAKPTAAPAKPTAAPAKPAAAATQAPAAKPALKPLRLGQIQPAVTFSYAPIGVELGLYEKAGLTLDLKHFQNDILLVQAVVAGELDLMNANPSSTFASIEKGSPLKIIGANSVRPAHVLYAEKSITGFKDLYGKSVAVSGVNSLTHNLVRVAMTKAGLDPGQVEFVATGTTGTVQSLLAGKANAAVALGDFIPMVEANPNYHVPINFTQAMPDWASGCFITSDALIASKPDVLLAGLIASTEALRWQADPKNRERTLASLQKFTGADAKAAEASFDWVFVKNKVMDLNCYMSPQGIQFVQEVNVMLGTQQAVLPIDKVNTYQLQQKVIEKLGRV